jgi:putative PIN family toxin of toxin-antitoxin system
MIVVMDSNVFFSALISPYGPPARILDAWAKDRFEVATCAEQLEEIRQASRYPKFRTMFKPHQMGRLLHDLQAAHVMQGFAKLYTTHDPTDDYLLNLAVAAEAHYLISGDKRSGLLSKPKVGTTRIFTAAIFCRRVLHEM